MKAFITNTMDALWGALLLLVLQGGSAPLARAQQHKAKMQVLDEMLQQPLNGKLITDEAYARLLYRKQVEVTGLSVQRGQTLGTSVTVGDKNATLNVGLADIKLAARYSTALIFNSRFNADQAFVKLFSEDDPRITVGWGGTVILFGNSSSKFGEREKKDFHAKLRALRRADKTKLKWQDTLQPHTLASWQKLYIPRLDTFARKWCAFQAWLTSSPGLAGRFYGDTLTDTDRLDLRGQRYYLDYLDAEQKASALLPPAWDRMSRAEEKQFLGLLLGVADPCSALSPDRTRIQKSVVFQNSLSRALDAYNEKALKARYDVYDSLQQRVHWTSKRRSWLTFSFLSNVIDQPIFDIAKRQQTYASTYRDRYWPLQLNYNVLQEGRVGNISGLVGLGTSNQLAFRKSDLHTYQTTTWQRTGSDSAQLVTQKSLYAAVPERTRFLTVQTQATATFNQGLPGYGITAAYEVLLAANKHGVHNVTVGVIVPVRTGTTTLLIIPQARARGLDQPNRWSFGFTITASVPNFLLNRF